MRLDLRPGSAYGCNINAHRSQWDGTICKAASSWACGAKQEFRDDYCEQGDSRCYHINTFASSDASVVIDDNGGSWLFDGEPEAFDDQILLVWGGHAVEPRGVRDTKTAILFGAYRVQRIEPRPRNNYTEWVVRPYPEDWARFAHMRIPVPRWESLQGPYLKQVDRSAVERVFERVALLAKESATSDATERSRIERFARELPRWLDLAAKRTEKLRARHTTSVPVAAPAAASPLMNRPLKDLGSLVKPTASTAIVPAPAPSKPITTIPPTTTDTPFGVQDALDPAAQARIAARHGDGVLAAVRIGWMTKPLLILRGSPGVGKSDLACSLIDDASGERMLTVAVDPTWRGKEDLLGHVNPINGEFEPTPVTNFLRRAAGAWDKGDRRAHVVVFEEFNLSQPEHWLSEVLVRSQYSAAARKDRTIRLGGARVRGWGEKEESEVFLSPALRLVGTINSDHTVRALSPRVLDRAAVVVLAVQPSEALRRVGLTLEKQELDAVADLDFRLRQRGAVFSYRTAESLKACLSRLTEMNLDRNRALDLVLAQEVLSKVRLLAADPADIRLCDELVEWTESAGKGLLDCQRTIEEWREALQNGQDVQQT